MTTLGAFNWSTTRGGASAGQATLETDPLAAVSNTLRVSMIDADGNDREAVIGTVSPGDVIRVSKDFSVIVGNSIENFVTYWIFSFTVSTSFVASDEPDDAETLTLTSRTPGAWPDTDELAQVLNVDNVTDWQTTLDRVLAAAIAKVKNDVGNWDESSDLPTDSQAQAALRMGELIAARPDRSAPTRPDSTYLTLLTGQRRRFGIG